MTRIVTHPCSSRVPSPEAGPEGYGFGVRTGTPDHSSDPDLTHSPPSASVEDEVVDVRRQTYPYSWNVTPPIERLPL